MTCWLPGRASDRWSGTLAPPTPPLSPATTSSRPAKVGSSPLLEASGPLTGKWLRLAIAHCTQFGQIFIHDRKFVLTINLELNDFCQNARLLITEFEDRIKVYRCFGILLVYELGYKPHEFIFGTERMREFRKFSFISRSC